jgi:Family of unknown function (DUF6165)
VPLIEISTGELIDRLTILEIRMDRVSDPAKRANVAVEYDLVAAVYAASVPRDVAVLKDRLRQINETLWDVEDRLRDCERRADFGPAFVELARSVYINNDLRAAVKREINVATGSRLIEEKSYPDY